MKLITLFALLLVTVSLTSCGGKDGGGSNNKSLNAYAAGQPYTKAGYYNTQTQALEIDGVTYPPSQAYASVMGPAIEAARAANLQPTMINGVLKFRATINGIGTGAVNNTYQNGYQNSYSNMQPSYGQYGQAQLNLTSVQLYR